MRAITILFFFITYSVFSQDTDSVFSHDAESFDILDGWTLKAGIGLTNYRSAFKGSNYASSHEFAIVKKIHSHIYISSNLNIMNVKATRDLSNSVNSYTPYPEIYPYEGNGDYFNAKMTEISLVVSGNIPKVILSLGETFIFPEKVNISLNIGAGLCNFYSMKYNSISNSYIYAYGYNDVEGAFKERKSFWDLPKARVLIYGISVDYKLNKDSRISLSYFIHNTDTPYIDADKGSAKGDNIRNISLGYISSFDFLEKVKD